jgi:phage-related minor tail protein
MAEEDKSFEEDMKVTGAQLKEKVKELVKEGNVRRITIKDKDGNVILSIPVTIGVIGAVLAPILAAVGAVAALVADCTISVERAEKKKKGKK